MEELHTELGQTQIARFAGKTVGDVLKEWHEHGVRGNTVVGSAEDVADELCALAEGADLDGFLINPLIQPGSTVDFIEQVLPILKKRGAFRADYSEHTLRERMLGSGNGSPAQRSPGRAAPLLELAHLGRPQRRRRRRTGRCDAAD